MNEVDTLMQIRDLFCDHHLTTALSDSRIITPPLLFLHPYNLEP